MCTRKFVCFVAAAVAVMLHQTAADSRVLTHDFIDRCGDGKPSTVEFELGLNRILADTQ